MSLCFLSVWFKESCVASRASMSVPPDGTRRAYREEDVSGQRGHFSDYHLAHRVRLIPTQRDGHFTIKEVLERNVVESERADFGLENVLVHFFDMNGEWLFSQLFKEDHAMQDVEAVLYYFFRDKLEPDIYYRLVWEPQKRGPYPTRTGEHSEPKLREHSDLNSAQKVHRTDDRQVIITCYKTKIESC